MAPQRRIRAPGAAILATLAPVAPGDLRAATDAGWIVRRPSSVTKRALKSIDHETLWLALHLDIDREASAFIRTLRRRSQQLATDMNTLRASASLIERALGREVEMSLVRVHRDDDRLFRRSGEMLADLDLAREHLAVSANNAEWRRVRLIRATSRAERRSSQRYAGQWRAFVFNWLLRTLGDSWTQRQLAELIVASNKDFTTAPCPAFVADADVTTIRERIKKVLARNRDK